MYQWIFRKHITFTVWNHSTRRPIITQYFFFTKNTTTPTAFLLTSTDRHLVIRSCVLFLLQRQSSANCRSGTPPPSEFIQWRSRSPCSAPFSWEKVIAAESIRRRLHSTGRGARSCCIHVCIFKYNYMFRYECEDIAGNPNPQFILNG